MMPPARAPTPPHAVCAATAPDRPRRKRPRGIALLMTLAVVMLLTFFMSEYFFATGLELRGMGTFKEAQQARALARTVFSAVQIGLLQDEVEFFDGYRKIAAILDGGGAVPWNDGLLLTLQVAPQDHLYNVNELFNQQPGVDQELLRWHLFRNTALELEPLPDTPDAEPLPLSEAAIGELYAALYDWIDGDDEEYFELAAIRGAEADAYFGQQPEYDIKNGMLDRLTELRLVRGVNAAKVPWLEWERHFTALPVAAERNSYSFSKINVNTASYQEIVSFLQRRWKEPNDFRQSPFQEMQENVNPYVDRAEEIASLLAPEDGPREAFTKATLQEALEYLGFDDKYGTGELFTTVNEYYRVRIVTEVGQVRSRIEAMLNVPRDDNSRVGTSVDVLWAEQR